MATDRRKSNRIIARLLALMLVIATVLAITVFILVVRVSHNTSQLQTVEEQNRIVLLELQKRGTLQSDRRQHDVLQALGMRILRAVAKGHR